MEATDDGERGMNEISNTELKLTDLPACGAGWNDISEFALTFNGYRELGSFDQCAEIANARRHDSLTDLRTCLFFEQRRFRHCGEEPDEDDIQYIHALIEKIRHHVAQGNTA